MQQCTEKILAFCSIRKSQQDLTYVHGTAGNQTALNELVRVLPHNLTVLASTGLTLIGVDDKISGGVSLLPALGVHERPLHATGETGTTASSETGGLDLRNDPLVALQNHLLRLVPVTVLHRALEVGAVVAVKVGEDAVLVLQAALAVDGRCVLDSGHATLLLAILRGSRGLRCGGGRERADCALVEGGARAGGGAECGLGRRGKHCDGGQCWCLSSSYVRLRRLRNSPARCLVKVWSGEWWRGEASRSMMLQSSRESLSWAHGQSYVELSHPRIQFSAISETRPWHLLSAYVRLRTSTSRRLITGENFAPS